MSKENRHKRRPAGWNPVAQWYDSWMGAAGGLYHREVAVPAVMRLADIRPGQRVLDVGAGQGVLAPVIARAGGIYTGIDLSERLLHIARKRHGGSGRFIRGDARKMPEVPGLAAGEFDVAIFLLSIQDMHPLLPVLGSAGWALKHGGRIIILMTHPCFRIPRQSGWDWDAVRKLHSRRIDHYLTPLSIPMKIYPGQSGGTTLSFHRPLEQYVNALASCNLFIDSMQEIPAHASQSRENDSNPEIPLFLAMRACKGMK